MSLDNVLSWATENGAIIDNDVTFEKTEKGISAIYKGQDRFDNNQDLLKVPESITITPLLAEKVFGGNAATKRNRNPLTQLLLAKLRFDKEETQTDELNVSKFFKPYVDSLPTGKEIGSPLFWDDAERALIKGTDAHLAIDHQTSSLVEEWYQIIKSLDSKYHTKDYEQDISFYQTYVKGKSEQFVSYFNNPNSWTSFPAYLWAAATFTSRAFPFLLAGNEECKDMNEAFLVPIFDLLNHSNEVEVKWDSAKDGNDRVFRFKTQQEIINGSEIFNSYGPKTNQELLFGYGFVLDNNKEDSTVLALRIPEENIEAANKFGLSLTNNEVAYKITKNAPLSENLVKLFCFLVKNEHEKTVTLRNKLEGLQQLQKIVQQKIDFLKIFKNEGNVSSHIVKIAKSYKTTQRLLYQATFEEITKTEKSLLKQFKPLSFKTIYKNDKTFSNSLLLIFGIQDYEQLAKSDEVDRALLLWIIRVGNKRHYNEKSILPDWINAKYQYIYQRLIVKPQDVVEYRDIFKALFPSIASKIPEVYGKGDWGIKSFITAGKVIDEISFTRSANNEIFLIENVDL